MPGQFPSQPSCSCNIERSTPRSGADPQIPERGGRGNCDENTHHIGKSHHITIPGKPDELFDLPEYKWIQLKGVSSETIQYVADEFLDNEDDSKDYEECFDYVVPSNSDLDFPSKQDRNYPLKAVVV